MPLIRAALAAGLLSAVTAACSLLPRFSFAASCGMGRRSRRCFPTSSSTRTWFCSMAHSPPACWRSSRSPRRRRTDSSRSPSRPRPVPLRSCRTTTATRASWMPSTSRSMSSPLERVPQASRVVIRRISECDDVAADRSPQLIDDASRERRGRVDHPPASLSARPKSEMMADRGQRKGDGRDGLDSISIQPYGCINAHHLRRRPHLRRPGGRHPA